MTNRTNRTAWGLAAVLAAALVGSAVLIGRRVSLDDDLIGAVETNDLRAVRARLDQGASPNASMKGISALGWAAYNGHTAND